MPKVENCFSAFKLHFSLLKSVYFMLTILSELSIGSVIYIFVRMYFIFPSVHSIFRHFCTFSQTFLFESSNIWSQTGPKNISLLFVLQYHLSHNIVYYFGYISVFLVRSLTITFQSILFVVFILYCLCNEVMKNKLIVNPRLPCFKQQLYKDTNTHSFIPRVLCQRLKHLFMIYLPQRLKRLPSQHASARARTPLNIVFNTLAEKSFLYL